MGGGAHELGMGAAVAVATHLHLSGPGEDRILTRVDPVAVGAGHVLELMRAAGPVMAGVRLMAVQTRAVFQCRRLPGGEPDGGGRPASVVTAARHMVWARAVTNLAGAPVVGERCAAIAAYRVNRIQDVMSR